MGCDIHLYLERKRTINNNEQWINCDYWKCNPYYGEDYQNEYEIVNIYNGRNYELFAILADVRNYHNNTPISQPKGFPQDAHYLTRKEYEAWDCDGHSHSYFTLAELKEYKKKDIPVELAGLMTKENADLVDKGKMPHEWCQGTSNKDYAYRKWEMKENPIIDLIKLLDKRMRQEFWVWDNDDRPDLDEKFRIVFWFDN